jgi:hypothetical protein
LAYAAYNFTLDVGSVFAKEIADGINAAQKYIASIKAKKEATRKILAESNVEDLAQALNNCQEIASQSRLLQDSLQAMICKVKAGKLKANLSKLEAANKANVAFMNQLGPALAACQNQPSWQEWAEKPCNGPCLGVWEVSGEFDCQKTLMGVFGVKPVNYRVDIKMTGENNLDANGKSFTKLYIECNKVETKASSTFHVKYDETGFGGNQHKATEIFPYSYEGGLIVVQDNSYKAYENQIPLAGIWGDNLLSMVSGKTSDVVFFGKILNVCPNLYDDLKSPWIKYFNGAKANTSSAAFAENVKTISDIAFAVVDGWYVCKDVTKAIRLGWKAGGKAVVKEVITNLEYFHVQKPNKVTDMGVISLRCNYAADLANTCQA